MTDDVMLAELKRRADRQSEIMSALPDSLPTMTRIVMSGDMESAERVEEALFSGKLTEKFGERPGVTDYDHAIRFVGSFSRLDAMLRWQEAGYTTRDHLLDLLPHEWPACDPDDTDERFIDLWVEAWERNGRKPVRDGKHLPRGSELTVYRGQPPGAPLGCAWSLDLKVAERFARGAWARTPVPEGEIIKLDGVPRRRVLAYLTGRNESEVILDQRLIERMYQRG